MNLRNQYGRIIGTFLLFSSIAFTGSAEEFQGRAPYRCSRPEVKVDGFCCAEIVIKGQRIRACRSTDTAPRQKFPEPSLCRRDEEGNTRIFDYMISNTTRCGVRNCQNKFVPNDDPPCRTYHRTRVKLTCTQLGAGLDFMWLPVAVCDFIGGSSCEYDGSSIICPNCEIHRHSSCNEIFPRGVDRPHIPLVRMPDCRDVDPDRPFPGFPDFHNPVGGSAPSENVTPAQPLDMNQQTEIYQMLEKIIGEASTDSTPSCTGEIVTNY